MQSLLQVRDDQRVAVVSSPKRGVVNGIQSNAPGTEGAGMERVEDGQTIGRMEYGEGKTHNPLLGPVSMGREAESLSGKTEREAPTSREG